MTPLNSLNWGVTTEVLPTGPIKFIIERIRKLFKPLLIIDSKIDLYIQELCQSLLVKAPGTWVTQTSDETKNLSGLELEAYLAGMEIKRLLAIYYPQDINKNVWEEETK